MPLLTLRIARRDTPVTAEQKVRLIAGVTDVVQSVLDKRRKSSTVSIDEVDPDNGGRGRPDGDPVPRRQSAAAQRRLSRPQSEAWRAAESLARLRSWPRPSHAPPCTWPASV